jgi:uncharacterized repeat protein (TIGR03803 family)
MQSTSFLRSAAPAAVFALLALLVAFPKAQAQTETAIYSFCSVGGIGICNDGDAANGPLALDQYGAIYGTTTFGGNDSFSGTVFELFPEPAGGCESGTNPGNGWCEIVIYDFCSIADCADGFSPTGNLAYLNAQLGKEGNLYGTAEEGGATGGGIVFELSQKPVLSSCPSGTNPGNGWCETVLYNFCSLANCADGQYPGGNLVQDSDGNLFGTVLQGVFELSPNGSGGWTEELIYQDSTVVGGLAIDGSGNLYGADDANVFRLFYDCIFFCSWKVYNLHTFNGSPDGMTPSAPALDSAGNVYGTTFYGGSKNFGIIWKVSLVTKGKDAGTYKETILHSFTSPKFDIPPEPGAVTLDSSGNIYGTTAYAGSAECDGGCGTMFEVAVSGASHKYEVLWSFDETDGGLPNSNPILNSSGNLLGVTLGGGAYGSGTVFQFTP